MANSKAIRKRISVTISTQKLTRAMKMIASTSLRRAQAKVVDARVFQKECSRILSDVISKVRDVDIRLARAPQSRAMREDLVVFSSDKGLCGTFNEALFKQAVSFLNDKKAKGISVGCHVLGKKGVDFFRRSNIDTASAHKGISKKEGEVAAEETIRLLVSNFLEGRSDGAVLAYNEFKSVGSSRIVFKQLLPAEPPSVKKTFGIEHIYEPDASEAVEELVGQMISSTFRLALLESLASEVAARMIAMEKATQNADELISTLTIQYNKARQSAITSELVDIVGGVEALK